MVQYFDVVCSDILLYLTLWEGLLIKGLLVPHVIQVLQCLFSDDFCNIRSLSTSLGFVEQHFLSSAPNAFFLSLKLRVLVSFYCPFFSS